MTEMAVAIVSAGEAAVVMLAGEEAVTVLINSMVFRVVVDIVSGQRPHRRR